VTVTTIFCDIGGVLLTNGWDHDARRLAADRFRLDPEEFARRHDPVMPDFDCGRMSLERYLDATVFHRSRPFSREDFKSFMFAQSRPYAETLAVVHRLTASGRFLMATVNNESRELNDYRIAQFRLGELFSLFFSSCYLGVRKPDAAIYRLALDVAQRSPGECLFVDDREPNVVPARALGMSVIHYRSADQLERELEAAGVTA
jgi:putative hydrolase of the HAD superfamily